VASLQCHPDTNQQNTKLNPKFKQYIFTGLPKTPSCGNIITCSRIIQISRNIIFNKEDTEIYLIPGEGEEEMIPNLPIPMATITEINDNTVEQEPTPNTETVAPSMAAPEPG